MYSIFMPVFLSLRSDYGGIGMFYIRREKIGETL
jgi:hypothetical protein